VLRKFERPLPRQLQQYFVVIQGTLARVLGQFLRGLLRQPRQCAVSHRYSSEECGVLKAKGEAHYKRLTKVQLTFI